MKAVGTYIDKRVTMTRRDFTRTTLNYGDEDDETVNNTHRAVDLNRGLDRGLTNFNVIIERDLRLGNNANETCKATSHAINNTTNSIDFRNPIPSTGEANQTNHPTE